MGFCRVVCRSNDFTVELAESFYASTLGVILGSGASEIRAAFESSQQKGTSRSRSPELEAFGAVGAWEVLQL